MYSEIGIFLLRMFSLCCNVVMWLEEQNSDLQNVSLRLGRGRDLEDKYTIFKVYIGYS